MEQVDQIIHAKGLSQVTTNSLEDHALVIQADKL